MTKILDIALEKIEHSLKSGSEFVGHNVFRRRAYKIRANVFFHAVLCITGTYAIWQFFASAEKISFDSIELAIHMMVVLFGWLVGAALIWGALRAIGTKVYFKELLHLYVFVHANVILICSVFTLVFFVFAGDFALNVTVISETNIRQLVRSDPDFDLIITSNLQHTLYNFQIVFLALSIVFLMIYQPVHLKMVTGNSLITLYIITFGMTVLSLTVQVYLWQTANQTSDVVGRVLRSPGMLPL